MNKVLLHNNSTTRLLSVLLLTVLLLTGCSGGTTQQLGYQQVDAQAAIAMMEQQTDYILLDVRTQEEYDSGHIAGAICIPNETIGQQQPEALPDLEQLILVYCRSGNRSKQAAEKLVQLGYTNVVEFGGINTWPGELVGTMPSD